ncbi:MAG: hypothetical protein GTN38_01465 [Candidatus Aenigmarchaeota archaeon]|nr:hypothetical protein [Candidatus Aenigmarchaeota archaeon]NIQ17530.1 hypothetical protein [Candidatus Aenigmarchaeota archaeon]NIS73108.1 hypothetical protein [Candidatus Aenigmarchaeota archaeon]
MRQKILMALIMCTLFTIPTAAAYISEETCDAANPCEEGMECFSFPGIGLKCAQPYPCSYYKCPEGTRCAVAESYPPQVICSCTGPECSATGGDEDTVSYDLLTQTVIHTIDQNEQTVSHDISIWKSTPGNRGILETDFASVELSNELVVEESKLFMKTSVGKKPVNLLPEDVIGISETPTKEAVEKIELKEESQKPVYSVKGTKQARILFIIPVSMEVETNIDAETGDVISVNKPWWSFLAW